MSRTDKDRPLWVQNAEHGLIDHDHRTGECIISDDQRDKWNSWRNHWRRCNKRVIVEYNCTKDDPNFTAYSWRTRSRRQTCWTWVCECDIDEPHEWMFHCDNPGRVQCAGHTRVEYDDSIPCVCDDRPPLATCTPDWVYGRAYVTGGVPTWFVRQDYHRPERARERKLRDLAREYNTYGDIEDDDFVNRQARNSCRWTWW